MATKNLGLKVGAGMIVATGIFFLLKRWKSRGAFIFNGFDAVSTNLQEDAEGNTQQAIVGTSTGMTLIDVNTDATMGTYTWTGQSMAFPLSNDFDCYDENPLTPCRHYDNVAILQAFLLYESGNELDMKVDGQFGDKTTEAVIDQLTDIIDPDLGYPEDTYDWEEITQEYYDTFVVPFYEEYLQE